MCCCNKGTSPLPLNAYVTVTTVGHKQRWRRVKQLFYCAEAKGLLWWVHVPTPEAPPPGPTPARAQHMRDIPAEAIRTVSPNSTASPSPPPHLVWFWCR